jgi:hypothetical protein
VAVHRGEAALRFLASRTGRSRRDFAWVMVLVMGLGWYCNRKQRVRCGAVRWGGRSGKSRGPHPARRGENGAGSISLDSRSAAFVSSPKAATEQKHIKQRASEASARRGRERQRGRGKKGPLASFSISLAKESQSGGGSRSGWWAAAHVSCSSCFGGGVCGGELGWRWEEGTRWQPRRGMS